MPTKAIRGAVLAAGLLFALALIFGLSQCQHARQSGAAAKLERGRGEAAIDSGRDAVETIGNASARETDIHETVKEASDEIFRAPAGDSNDAADRAACRLRSYRDQPRCRALLDARPE